MRRQIIILLVALALVVPAYSAEQPSVPIKVVCSADPTDDMEGIFCKGMESAFKALEFTKEVEKGEPLFFEFGFNAMQVGETTLFVALNVSYFDRRFDGLHLSVYTGSLLFTRPEGSTNQGDAEEFKVLASTLMVAAKDWYDFAYPILKRVKVAPITHENKTYAAAL